MLIKLKAPIHVRANDGRILTFPVDADANYSSSREGAHIVHVVKLWDPRFQVHLTSVAITYVQENPPWL